MSNIYDQQGRYSRPQLSIKHACPQCSDQVYRVPRRFIDRLVGLFRPLHRYRCLSPHCNWEGNITSTPQDRAEATAHMG
jgi:hypothetical protein